MSLSKSSQQNVQNPCPRKYDDNELTKYMSNLPRFLQQQMEMRNIQDKTQKERPSSPMRRLSFDFGKMRRSLSFKDNSAVPELSHGYTGVKSTLQALLKVTLKNGLPFMKLAVNSSNDMLAAAAKSLHGCGKIETCMIYRFYSVHKVKKKSITWTNSKGNKSCNLGYNVVGQMKMSGSSDGESRECVLYGVDSTHDYVPNKEVAAVIVPNKEREFFHCVSEENRISSGTIVILPDGVHGAENKLGESSSLVSRFGGKCDCEGWDIGCKLRVLADDKKGSSSLQESMLGSANDRLCLYQEGRGKGEKPVFSLKPFSNGYYSIEFDASISLLEAFAVCVAYVTCLEFP